MERGGSMQGLTEKQLAELSAPSLFRFSLSLLADCAGIAAGFLLFAAVPSVPTFLAASVLIGLCQHGLVVLGHEAVHRTVCRNRILNEVLGNIFCFFPAGITLSMYRDFHFPHHRDPGGASDPELPIRKAMGKNWVPPFTLKRGFLLWGASFFGASLKELATFVSRLPRGKALELAMLGLTWGGVIALVHSRGLWAYLGLWFYALASTYFSTLRIQAWYEHSLDQPHANRYSLPSRWFRLLVPHNIWAHHEHHRYPTIPFYRLEAARALTSGERIYSFSEMAAQVSKTVMALPASEEPKKAA